MILLAVREKGHKAVRVKLIVKLTWAVEQTDFISQRLDASGFRVYKPKGKPLVKLRGCAK